eukprot:s2333_g1.t1
MAHWPRIGRRSLKMKEFYQKYKELAGPDLLTRLQETVTESKKTSSVVSFEGTGEFLDEIDLDKKYQDKPDQLANLKANTRTYFCPVRQVQLFEDVKYTRKAERKPRRRGAELVVTGEKRCKFMKRFDAEDMGGKSVKDIKTFMCQWCSDNFTNLQSVMTEELKVFDGKNEKDDNEVIATGRHIKVVYEHLMVRLGRALDAHPNRDQANKAFMEALLNPNAPASSSDALASSDYHVLVQKYEQTIDSLHMNGNTTLQELAEIHPHFGGKLYFTMCANPASDDESDGEQSVPETTTQVPEGYLSEVGAPSVAGEPEDEPSGVALVVQLKSLLKEPHVINDFVVQKGWSVAKLRDEIMKEHGIPMSKSKTVKLYNPRTMKYLLEDTRIKVSTLVTRNDLIDGDELHLSTNITGGARAVTKQTKKDMIMKANEYKKAMSEANSLINRPSVEALTAVQNAEVVLQTFATNVEVNAENALMTVFSNLNIQKLDAIYAELARKGGNMESKLANVSVDVFGMEDVATASESIANILQSASSMLMYGVTKLNAENKVKDMSAVKTILDRAKFMKMGQEAMASAPQQPQNVANAPANADVAM